MINSKRGESLYSKYLKRVLDFILSSVIILVLSPFFLIISFLLLINNNGEVLFIQQRPGKDGRIFGLIKFKTMNDKKDSNGNLLPDSKRLTAIGRFLRSTSIDEIPQLLNVLIGDISLIGPRPLLVRYLRLYNQQQRRRHEVRPGITGWAQVHGRNAISWEKKFEYDVWYVDNVSFLLDMKIIGLTIKKVLLREGINAGEGVTMGEFKGTIAQGSELGAQGSKEEVVSCEL